MRGRYVTPFASGENNWEEVHIMRRKLLRSLMFIFIAFCLTSCEKNIEKDESIVISAQEINLNQYFDNTGAKVIFIYDKNDILYKFIVFGSTNYNEYGEDIVASALSILSFNTINSLLELTDIDIKYESKEVKEKPYLECYISELKNKKQGDEFELLLKSLKLGVESIEHSYGSQYVEVVEIH